jgi:hypothetical protein
MSDCADGRAVRVTLGELVEAIADVTDDVVELTLVVEHILRSRATQDPEAAGLRSDLAEEP